MLKTSQTSEALREALDKSLMAQKSAQQNVAQLLPVCQEQQKQLAEQEAQRATMQAQLTAQQSQLAALQSQLAAQQSQLDRLEAFHADIIQLYGTNAQTDVVAAMLGELDRNPELAFVIGSADKEILSALLDDEVDPTLMQFFPQPEHEDEENDDDAGSEAIQRECITKFNKVVRAALERMVARNPSAPAFGTTAEILAKILRENCESPDPDFFHMAYSQVTRDPEWEIFFQAWDDANSASQAQPSSAGKQAKPCKHWAATGSCSRGDNCWFTH